MTQWMIHPSYLQPLQQAWSATVDAAKLEGTPASAAEPLDVVDGVARVQIKGVLLNERRRLFDMFGIAQTSYADIAAQIREAESSPEIRAIELQVDSGGGLAGNGLVDTAELIAATTKPVTAVVGEMAASAAYWLVAQANTLVLAGAATRVGGIGAVVEARVSDNSISITSTNAPKKRPDVRTEAGRADIREHLDALHELFVAAVARGRGVSAETVNSDFGQGGVLLAAAAVKAGMADRVISAGPPIAKRDTIAAMDRDTLLREHPKLFASIVDEGVVKERDRVTAHLELAEGSGAADVAVGHIREGRDVDQVVTSVHLKASMIAQHQQARVDASAPPIPTAPPQGAAGGGESSLDADVRATFALCGHTYE